MARGARGARGARRVCALRRSHRPTAARSRDSSRQLATAAAASRFKALQRQPARPDQTELQPSSRSLFRCRVEAHLLRSDGMMSMDASASMARNAPRTEQLVSESTLAHELCRARSRALEARQEGPAAREVFGTHEAASSRARARASRSRLRPSAETTALGVLILAFPASSPSWPGPAALPPCLPASLPPSSAFACCRTRCNAKGFKALRLCTALCAATVHGALASGRATSPEPEDQL